MWIKRKPKASNALMPIVPGRLLWQRFAMNSAFRFFRFLPTWYSTVPKANPIPNLMQQNRLTYMDGVRPGGEKAILENNPKALVVRTSSFFGPWDGYNFVYKTLCALKEGRLVEAASDVYMSPTYVPDLVHRCLDLLLDGEEGIFHLANDGVESWKGLAERIALLAGYDTDLIREPFAAANKMESQTAVTTAP
jgi:hypothetical protein